MRSPAGAGLLGRALRIGLTGTLCAVLVSGCTERSAPVDSPAAGSGSSAVEHSAEPTVSLVPGDTKLEQVSAAVVVRHLRQQGVAAEVLDPRDQPWTAAEGDVLAIEDTLHHALDVDQEQALGADPTPAASPTPTASPATASPTPWAPASEGEASGDGLPRGEDAADAGAVDAIVRDHLPEGVEMVATSNGTLRLQAVTTQAVAGLLDLEELTDLDGQCWYLRATPQAWGALVEQRLQSLAGCEPQEWTDPGEAGPALALVEGQADLALLYGTDPAITDHALVPLADSRRILPEGRIAALAEVEAVPDGVQDRVREILSRLDGTQLMELENLTSGPDPLTPDEAAQYWLVRNGLEPAPEGWY